MPVKIFFRVALVILGFVMTLPAFASGTDNLLNDGFPAHRFKNITPQFGGLHCGSGWTELLIPDSFRYSTGDFSFAKACIRHDRCYGRRAGKQRCDEKFYQDLRQVCFRRVSKNNPSYVRPCLSYADFYHEMVVKYGSSYYGPRIRK